MCERKLHTHILRKRKRGRKRSFWHLLVSLPRFHYNDKWWSMYVCYSFTNVPVGPRKIVVCYFNDNTNNRKRKRETDRNVHCNVFTWAYVVGESTFLYYMYLCLLYVWLCLTEQEYSMRKDIIRFWSIIKKWKKKKLFPKRKWVGSM